MVLLRKGVLTSGCTHVHTSQFRYSVYLQLYLSIQFSVVFALDRCSWVRWLSGSLLCRDFVVIVTKSVLSFRKGSDDRCNGFEEPRSRSTRKGHHFHCACALMEKTSFAMHWSRLIQDHLRIRHSCLVSVKPKTRVKKRVFRLVVRASTRDGRSAWPDRWKKLRALVTLRRTSEHPVFGLGERSGPWVEDKKKSKQERPAEVQWPGPCSEGWPSPIVPLWLVTLAS